MELMKNLNPIGESFGIGKLSKYPLRFTHHPNREGGEKKLHIEHDDHEKFFTFFVDNKEFHTPEPQITGGQIMDITGIPRSTGLIEIMEDGSQVQINENEVIEFKGSGRRFKKAPRFKRG